jgi:hypothetical protein
VRDHDGIGGRDHHLEELRALARQARDKARLYRARMHGPRPGTPGRLAELEREAVRAEERMRHAEGERGA